MASHLCYVDYFEGRCIFHGGYFAGECQFAMCVSGLMDVHHIKCSKCSEMLGNDVTLAVKVCLQVLERVCLSP